jgi:hypothetical protein
MLTGFKLMAMTLFILDFFQLRKIEKAEEKAELATAEMESVKLRSNSIISLDKLFEESGESELMEPKTVGGGCNNSKATEAANSMKPTCT